jgi:dGTPase
MKWQKLLSEHRIGKVKPSIRRPGRSPFHIDYDRIIFSSAFRRLQDKTQVHPLSDNDYIRRRLTHSLEVSCIARSIGNIVGAHLCEKHKLENVHYSDFGAIVSAAALAHDIGNPPFGHSGEDAIRHWFHNSLIAQKVQSGLSDKEKMDISRYEGNAQGFRMLAKLQMPDNPGGMQLTAATLGAFMKYPIESYVKNTPKTAATKKFGFFQSEKELFAEVAEKTGLNSLSATSAWWTRHPLVFIVEAADDITYRVVDFEDGFRLGLVNYKEVSELFIKILGDAHKPEILNSIQDDKNKVDYLRASALGCMVQQVSDKFLELDDALLAGDVHTDIMEQIPAAEALKEITNISINRIYADRRATEIEAAGFEVTSGLMDIYIDAILDKASSEKICPRSKMILKLIPEQFLESNMNKENMYPAIMKILDYVSGMTDTYAVSNYRKLKGISLPGSHL